MEKKEGQQFRAPQRRKFGRIVIIFIIIFNFTAIIFSLSYRNLPTAPRDYHREPLLGTYIYYFDSTDAYNPYLDGILDDLDDMVNIVMVSIKGSFIFPNNWTPDFSSLNRVKNLLGNLSAHGIDAIIHLYSTHGLPSWVEENSTETYVKNGYRIQVPPNDWTYWNYMEQYCKITANFLNGTSNIYGYCLADEPNTNMYVDLYGNMSLWLKSVNPELQITIMLNRVTAYEAYEPVCDFFAIDPYQSDIDFANTLKSAREATDKKIIVLQSGMGSDDGVSALRMRREAWIAWFMGADQIWFWSYNIYWEGFRGGEPNDWHVVRWDPNDNRVLRTSKADAAVEIKRDIELLSEIDGYLFQSDADSDIKAELIESQMEAYYWALQNNFERARLQLIEAVMISNQIPGYGE